MQATLSTYRQSPRKVRLVADMVRGKKASEALAILTLVPKRAGLPLRKLVASAVSNSKEDASNLLVKEIRVDAGQVMKRQMPRAFGRAYLIKKRTSHIIVKLSPVAPLLSSGTEKTKKAPAKKIVAKKKVTKKTSK